MRDWHAAHEQWWPPYVPAELVTVIEGLALYRPLPLIATMTRQAGRIAAEQGLQTPSYSTVRAIVAGLEAASRST